MNFPGGEAFPNILLGPPTLRARHRCCPVPPTSVPVLPHPLPHVLVNLSVRSLPGPRADWSSLGGQGMLVDAEFNIWTSAPQGFCPRDCPCLGPGPFLCRVSSNKTSPNQHVCYVACLSVLRTVWQRQRQEAEGAAAAFLL